LILFAIKAFAHKIDIVADNLEYDDLYSKLDAKGHVVLYWKNIKLHADHVELFIDKKILNSDGNIKFEESKNTIYANRLTYNYKTESGNIEETFSYLHPIFIRACSMEKLNKDTYLIKNIKLSNCDLNNPHVYFKAKRGKISMNKRVTLYWPFFYIGKVPIFFSPIITKSLKNKKSFASDFEITIEPSYTNNEGISLKTKILSPLNKYSTAGVKYDYLGIRGHGYGGNIKYLNKNKKLDIDIYTINDLIEKRKRWKLNTYYEQKINKWEVKSEIKFMSDKDFNTHFDKNNKNIENILRSYAYLIKQGKNTALEIYAKRFDKYNKFNKNYEILSSDIPIIKFTYFPKSILFNITHDFIFKYKYNNNYEEHTHTNISSLNYGLKKAFTLGKFTLKPNFIITKNLYDKNKLNNKRNIFITKYSNSLNLRYRATNWIDCDINYLLRTRTKENSLYIDRFAEDHGIEINKFFFKNFMYIGSKAIIITDFSYNFNSQQHKNNQKKGIYMPLKSEIIWTPKHYFTTNITQTHLLNPFQCQNLNLDLKIGDSEKIYLELGIFYKKHKPINNIFGFGIWLTPKWKFDYYATANNEHKIKLYRDSHCYNLNIGYNIKKKKHEEFLKFDIKTNMSFNKKNEKFNNDKNSFY
jgi:LPS-assembly protein